MRAKPAVVKGDPRSDVNTKGELGRCSKVVNRCRIAVLAQCLDQQVDRRAIWKAKPLCKMLIYRRQSWRPE